MTIIRQGLLSWSHSDWSSGAPARCLGRIGRSHTLVRGQAHAYDSCLSQLGPRTGPRTTGAPAAGDERDIPMSASVDDREWHVAHTTAGMPSPLKEPAPRVYDDTITWR
jgi:hypothetical protein